MKGTIHKCLEELVKKKYNDEAWEKCLESAQFPSQRKFSLVEDIEEKSSIDLIVKTAETLEIPLDQLFDEFGEYWCCTYAPKHYSFWYIGPKNAKEFVLKLDEIHRLVGKHFNNAQPPRFDYSWLDPEKKSLEVTYTSSRNLLDLYISLVKGLGIYFKENIDIKRLNDAQVVLDFEY